MGARRVIKDQQKLNRCNMKKYYFFIMIMVIPFCMFAQNQEIVDPDKKTDWWEDPDGFINQQAGVTLGLANDLLKMHPPTPEEPLKRKMALLMIDNVLHEEQAAYRPSVQKFLHDRIKNVVEEIRTEQIKEGAVIYKLYNHAFVVKTPSVTFGFDLTRGLRRVEAFALREELVRKLIDVVDVCFVSHLHRDHADGWVAERFLEQNKPVVAPPNVWSDEPFYQKITHLKRKAHEIQELYLPSKGINLQVVNYPGHQGETIPNNVYLVHTPEGMTFSQTGDQSNHDDFEWIDQVGDYHKVDVVMPNCWTTDIKRLIRGFRPGLTIPGHENEMGHRIDHREPFWLNYIRLSDIPFSWIQMTWGEKYHYLPEHGE